MELNRPQYYHSWLWKPLFPIPCIFFIITLRFDQGPHHPRLSSLLHFCMRWADQSVRASPLPLWGCGHPRRCLCFFFYVNYVYSITLIYSKIGGVGHPPWPENNLFTSLGFNIYVLGEWRRRVKKRTELCSKRRSEKGIYHIRVPTTDDRVKSAQENEGARRLLPEPSS